LHIKEGGGKEKDFIEGKERQNGHRAPFTNVEKTK